MKWSAEAKEALSKVPFFVRKRVKGRVEEEAAHCGAGEVRLEHVKTCQKRFLNQMEDEVKGYQVETCFGASGCSNRAVISEDFPKKVEKRLAGRDLKSFLKDRTGIAVLSCQGKRGHPVIFSSAFRDALCSLNGNLGGRTIIEKYPSEVKYVEAGSKAVLVDIDTPEDYNKLSK